MRTSRRRLALWIGLCAVSLLALSRSRFPDPVLALSASQAAAAQPAGPKYDLLLRGGHVIDARNKISAVRDVAIAGGQDCGRRRESQPCRRHEDRGRQGALRHTRPRRHPYPYVYGHGRAAVLRGRQQRLPGRIHPARRRDDGGGRGMRRLAQLRGLQAAHHRSLEDPRPRLPQHRRQRHARGRPTSRTSRTWKRSRPPTWRAGIQG